MDNKKPEKTFKEKIENLKKSSLAQHIEPKFWDFLPEDFYLLDKRRMMYMWHFLSDKRICELYGVSEYEVRKRRRDFVINSITSTFDRIARETYCREDWVEEELKTILPFEYNNRGKSCEASL